MDFVYVVYKYPTYPSCLWEFLMHLHLCCDAGSDGLIVSGNDRQIIYTIASNYAKLHKKIKIRCAATLSVFILMLYRARVARHVQVERIEAEELVPIPNTV